MALPHREPIKRIRILLVEDDANISKLVAELLDLLGHDVCGTAVTESEAIDAAGLHAPDLMIVDVWLRAGNGVSAMSIIHRRNAMPHIFMTGGSRHTIPKGSIVLHKPFGTADLTKALDCVVWQIAPAAPRAGSTPDMSLSSTATNGAVLTINSGSSSLKFALFAADGDGACMARGEISDLPAAPHLRALDAAQSVLLDRRWPAGVADPFGTALRALLDFAESHLGEQRLGAVGHRIVHGGAAHVAPALITQALLADLEALTPLDPLHMPHSLAPVHAVAASRPGLPQVACFDTAFHDTLPAVARRVALPRALAQDGVRRYGFHGLSYEFIARQLAARSPALARGRVIVAHLGSGASLCALQNGRSIATTMGFSALDGLVMATRCGSLDPGIILYLLRQGHDAAGIEDMLYHQSGLLGVSGLSDDIRTLLASDDPRAAEAIELFTYRIATEAGGLVSALKGLDGLVFTAGIGEHSAAIRSAVCDRLAWLGIHLDPAANADHAGLTSTPGSSVAVWMMPTDEEAMIELHTRQASR